MKILYHLLLFSIFLLSACRTPIDLDLMNIDNKIVVNSAFSPDSLIKIYLTSDYSPLIRYDNYDPENINNASIYLYKNDIIIDTFSFIGNGEYLSSIYPLIGSNYKIEIQADNFSTVNAYDLIPQTVPINSISYELTNDEIYNNKFNITFTDPPEKNYYILHFPNDYYFKSNDPVFGQYAAVDDEFIFVFNDEIFNGNTYSITVYGNIYIPSHWDDSERNMHFYLHSISENLYKYFKTYNKQVQRGDDLMELYQKGLIEPIPIYSNIENGLGIFGGFSTSCDSIFLPDSIINN